MKEKIKILNEFLDYKQTSLTSSKKLEDYRRYIKRFLDSDKRPLKDFDEKHLIDFINSLKVYSGNTTNDIKAFVKEFIKYSFIDYSARYRNLERLCKTQKTESPYQPEDMINEKDFEKLLIEEKSIFWKAYFITLFYGCCRPSELFTLKWKDLDMTSDPDGGIYFPIYSKKNKTTFWKYIPDKASYYIKQLQNNNSDYVFINPTDNKLLKRQQPYYEIKKISKRALGRSIDLYTIRHSIATINYQKDIKDDIIAMQMGHSKSMKKVYSHNDLKTIKNNAKKIYVGELPPERKEELEFKLKLVITQMEKMQKDLYINQKMMNLLRPILAEAVKGKTIMIDDPEILEYMDKNKK